MHFFTCNILLVILRNYITSSFVRLKFHLSYWSDLNENIYSYNYVNKLQIKRSDFTSKKAETKKKINICEIFWIDFNHSLYTMNVLPKNIAIWNSRNPIHMVSLNLSLYHTHSHTHIHTHTHTFTHTHTHSHTQIVMNSIQKQFFNFFCFKTEQLCEQNLALAELIKNNVLCFAVSTLDNTFRPIISYQCYLNWFYI